MLLKKILYINKINILEYNIFHVLNKLFISLNITIQYHDRKYRT